METLRRAWNLPTTHTQSFLVAVVVLWSVAMYLPVLMGGTFVYDDLHSIVDNPHFRDWRNIPSFFWDTSNFSNDPERGMYRPLVLVSYWLCWTLFGLDPVGWHCFNLALHLACCAVLWTLGGGVSAVLFAFSPLAVEPVAYLSARSETMMAFFVLLTLKNDTWDRLKKPWLGVLFFACAMLCKETAVMVLPLMIAVNFLINKNSWVEWYGRLRWHFVALLGYLLVLHLTGFARQSAEVAPRDLVTQIYTGLGALPHYAQNLLTASALSIDPALPVFRDPWHWPVALGLLLFSVGAGTSVYWWRTRPDWALGWCWLGCFLLPFVIVPLTMVANDRRLYLPAMILVMFAAGERLGRQWWPAVLAGLLLLSSVQTIRRAQVWGNEVVLWEDAARQAPNAARVINNLGDAYRKRAQAQGDPQDWLNAWNQYHRVTTLNDPGQMPLALNNLGAIALEQNRDAPRAEMYFRRALAMDRRDPNTWANLGTALVHQGDLQRGGVDAVQCYQEALNLQPLNWEANYNLAWLIERRYPDHPEMLDYARHLYAQALVIRPNDPRPFIRIEALNAHNK